MMDAPHPKKLYGRRKGWKLGPHQQSLMETLLPRITLAPARGRDPREYFETPVREVWLEVGFGGGEHLLWQAQHHPDVGVIGAEPFVAGIAKLLSSLAPYREESARRIPSPPLGERARERGALKIERDLNHPLSPTLSPGGGEGFHGGRRGNIIIYPGDAADVIGALPDGSLDRAFVLFPDPWPKTRHHKRRFLQTGMLDQLARVLRSGAELRFASDDAGYIGWALERFMAHPLFVWIAQSPHDWRARTDDWPQTRYEQKALHGRPYYFRFAKV